MSDPSLSEFRAEVAAFIAASTSTGIACPAYGAILTPDLYDEAVAWQRHCHQEGFAGIHWPAEHGGRGLSRAHAGVWFEECARAGVAPYLNLQGIVLAGEAILRAGTPEQRRRYLEPTLRGDLIWCQLFSEPGSGSDLASLQTSAIADGERYVVNGQKVWSSNADVAGAAIMLARTDRDRPSHKGISFFLLDMTLPGVEVRPLRQMTGQAEFCEVFLTDVPMPADALLGAENEGWRVAMEVLTDERGAFKTAGVISLTKRLAELAASGTAEDPVERDGLARLMARGHALGHLLGRDGDEARMAPIAKVLRSEIDFAAAAHQLDGLGPAALVSGLGRTDDSDDIDDSEPTDDAFRQEAAAVVERFLYAPGMRIAGGSSEIQRNIIGERILGLPRGPR